MKRQLSLLLTLFFIFLLSSCALLDEFLESENTSSVETVTSIEELVDLDHFRDGAIQHILEGELNRRGEAVGFHYNMLPTKKGEIVSDSKTDVNEFGVYEAKVIVKDVEKTSNKGKSTFFPDEWDSQDVIDAINEAHEDRTFISGNTYEGLTEEGIVLRMYLDDQDKIISAFPVY